MIADDDELESALEQWADAVEGWKEDADKAARLDAHFKAWCAATKKVALLTGSSAAKAEIELMADPEWHEKFLIVNAQNIVVENWKKKLRIAEAAFEAERSRQATLRQVR